MSNVIDMNRYRKKPELELKFRKTIKEDPQEKMRRSMDNIKRLMRELGAQEAYDIKLKGEKK